MMSEKETPPETLPIRLLLVDDSAAFRGSMRTLLETQPRLTVLGEAGDGPTAMRLIGKLSPDVVIMDVIMPDQNGVEVTRQISARYPSVKVIALSMHAEDRFVTAMRSAGAVGYVLKDQVAEQLAAAVLAVAGGQVYFQRP